MTQHRPSAYLSMVKSSLPMAPPPETLTFFFFDASLKVVTLYRYHRSPELDSKDLRTKTVL